MDNRQNKPVTDNRASESAPDSRASESAPDSRASESAPDSRASESVTDNHRYRRILTDMLAGRKGVLVGYSGGADSTALLYLLCQYVRRHTDMYLKAVHIHHGIRGEEADRDAAHCRRFCENLGVDFVLIKADIPAMAKKTHTGIEETARDFRYRTFARLVREDSRLDCIATAHNADDNAETLLFRLIRGTGIDGLSGIPPMRMADGITVLRPLLKVGKREILAYCDGNRLSYIHDSSNDDTAYTRNYIRHELLPRIEKMNPAFLKAAERLTLSAKEDSDYLESVAADFLNRNRSADGAVPLAALRKLPRPILSRVLRQSYEATVAAENGEMSDTVVARTEQSDTAIACTEPSKTPLQYVHTDALTELVTVGRENSRLSLPNRYTAVIENRTLRIYRVSHGISADGRETDENQADGFCYPLKIGVNIFEKENFAWILRPQGENCVECEKDYENFKNIYKLSIQSKLKSDTINHSFYIRSRRDGDVCFFGGMTRKLKQLYNERGYSREVRAGLPLLCDEDGIVWIPGFRTADRMSVGRTETASGSRTETMSGNQAETTSGRQSETISGNQAETTSGSRIETTSGSQTETDTSAVNTESVIFDVIYYSNLTIGEKKQ